MIKSYRSYNFIISDKLNESCSGRYFNILSISDEIVEAIMLRDLNFSLFQKNDTEFNLYLAKGIIYDNIEKITNSDNENNLISKFKQSPNDNKIYVDEHNNKIKFYTHETDKGIFMSNPHLILQKKYIDILIDNR